MKLENNLVVSGHHLTSKAAKEILDCGGNAFDAAIAAFFMAWVVEPTMAGAGGGGFANVYTKDKKSILFDFFCQTPIIKRPVSELDFYPIEIDFGDQTEIFHIGEGAVATPGNVAGIFELHKQLGSIPIRELANQAIQTAKDGFVTTPFQARIYGLTETMLRKAYKNDNPYLDNNNLINAASNISFSQKADFLDYLTREGKSAFYEGEIAQKFIQNQICNGGHLTMADMKNYQVILRKPLLKSLRNHKLLLNPFPSIGGASIAVLATYFDEYFDRATQPFSREHVELQMKIQNSALKISKIENDLVSFLKNSETNKLGSTTHFAVADKWGNAIGLTASIGEGAGVQIPQTQILLNNMLGEAALLPNGFHSWKPNTRLGSMMSPSIVIDENKNPILVTGSSGAGRIPMAIFSVIVNQLAFDLPIKKAVNGPRIHVSNDLIHIEKGFDFSKDEISNCEVQEWTDNSMFFGGANSISKEGPRWVGAVDNRREGLVS